MEESNKKDYELGLMLTSEEAVASVVTILNQAQVDIKKQENPRKIRLSYAIKKQIEAYFAVIIISASPDQLPALEETLKFSDFILRYLLIKPVVIKETAKAKASTSTSPIPVSESAEPSPADESTTPEALAPAGEPKKALTNEALEKKLEEILN